MKNILFKLLGIVFVFTAFTPCSGQFDIHQKMALSIDASTFIQDEDAIIFFNGNAVQFYSLSENTESAFSVTSIDNFPNWQVVSAALPWGENEILLFQEQEFVIYNPLENAIAGTGKWDGLPIEWGGGLDAACQWGDDTFLFFYGSEVVVYHVENDSYEEVDLMVNWEGWPSAWKSGIDSAVNVGSGIVYFFRGPAYIAYDMETGIFENPTKTSTK